jgi:hypothetical protein
MYTVYQNKRMIQIPAHRDFFIKRTQHKSKSLCVMLLKEKKERKFLYLERRSPVHGGEFTSSQVPCLMSTDFMPLALPSPSHPLPAKKTFIYTQTTLTCQLLLSGTSPTLCRWHCWVKLPSIDIAKLLLLNANNTKESLFKPQTNCWQGPFLHQGVTFDTMESLLNSQSQLQICMVPEKLVRKLTHVAIILLVNQDHTWNRELFKYKSLCFGNKIRIGISC